MELMQLDDEHINLLKAVLNSFMRDPSRFIDDTSVEKLLSWLSTVCRCEIQVERLGQDWILQFIYDSLDQDKAVITAFAIRLIGMLAAWPFYFQRMQNLRQYNLLDLLASMPSQSSWKSATVRDAYFKAANNLIPCRRSFNWIVAKDMVTVGLSALGDDSIFVMKSAINFVVQYLLWHGRHHFQEHSCDQEPMDLQYYNDVINEISNLLTQSKLSLASIDSQLELSICNPKLLSEILYRPLHLVMYGMFTRDEQDVSLERSIDISLDILKAPILADGYQDLVSATWINSVVVLFALCSCPSLLTKETISKVNDNITGSIKIARAALDFVSHSIKQIKIIRQSQLPFCPLLGEAIDPVYVILAAINQIDLEEAILIKSLNLLSEILLELNDDEIILLLDTYRISSNQGNKEIYQQVINGDLVEKIWKLSNDDEGFVKASALNSMCQLCSAISKPDDLDPVFKENKISDAVFQIILNDTEALARRSAIDLVIQCFKYGFILKDVGNCASETAQDIINVLRNESNITSTLRQSCHDLDWEVKRRGLLFWKAFIERHWQESCTEATAKHYTITSHNSKIILSLVLSGCAIALQDAIEDCDVVIRQESCAILLSLQTKLNLDLLADSKAAITEQLRFIPGYFIKFYILWFYSL
ncbi:uncharacterized protein TRIADDRAFT_52997 [Trichoplax adhaerens]|uniref:Uncharacterized protein n=1 Tax=Trichoplax adhaerens TaxID=10228 RepID=B3RN12_TRIAD|nr:hypothetical protein TRIADDRAFT_52997 [Trichoplax adhaerens]EDV27937.1 hypothetical protein TRIADDRAFT_52997 [Trichoplax adhaerens]|eukprot:XP_002109771.1 hypothetical protein TRIADDRAFT_52997 [Trichoplax adhaerens]